MSVYIDDAMIPFGRMLMSHMMADTTDELLAMAARIGVSRRWLQNAGKPTEHFDVCKEKREDAILAGAIPVSQRAIVEVVRRKRSAVPPPNLGPAPQANDDPPTR